MKKMKKILCYMMVCTLSIVGFASKSSAATAPITFDSNNKAINITLSDGNLVASGTQSVKATVGVVSGKWYWEVKPLSTDTYMFAGIASQGYDVETNVLGASGRTGATGYYFQQSAISFNGSYVNVPVPKVVKNDIVGIALDVDNKTITWYRNGVLIHTDTRLADIAPSYFPAVALAGTGCSCNINFGATPFQYSVPSGFKPYDNAPGTPTIEQKLKVVLEPKEKLQLSVDDDLEENTKLIWTSSDTSVATVDGNGEVTAIKKGNTVITSKNADGTYLETINVLVVDDADEYRLAVDLRVGSKCRLTIDDYTNTVPVTWTSMDPIVASISAKGKVKAVSKGLALMTATDSTGNIIGQIYVRVRV